MKSDRLRVLESTELLDTLPEPAFDRLTRLASGLLNAPVAIVSLVDAHRQFFKSALGLKEPWASRRETPLTHSFCQYAVEGRANLIVDDAREHPVLRDNHAIRDLGVIAYAGVPLFIEDQAIGAFCVIDDHQRHWTVDEVKLLDDLAQSVTSEIQLRLALRAERARRMELEGHRAELARHHEERRRLEELQGVVLANISDGVAFVDDRKRITFANDGFATMANLSRDELTRVTRDELFAHLKTLVENPEAFEEDELAKPGFRDIVFVRPRRRIVQRTRTPVGGGFLVTWRDVTLEREVQREREKQLVTDPLTGIANRRAADAALHAEIERANRAGSQVSVALLDVDHFKSVNDRFGHGAGDEVLRQIAATLSAQARLNDTVARWGGEEFIAILPIAREGAVAFAERTRLAIQNLRCEPVGRVTISVGVAEVGPGEAAADAVARADERLYEAKRAGRNRVQS